MDGFFVAKFQKIGPTPANAVRATGNASSKKASIGEAGADGKADVDEVVDKTPIATDEESSGEKKDDFGGFDDDEDRDYMDRAKRNAMRRRGLDPKALDRKGGKKGKKTE